MKVISAILLIALLCLCGLILLSHQSQQQVYDFCNQLYSGLALEELQNLATNSDMQFDTIRSSEQMHLYVKPSPVAFWELHACQVNYADNRVVSLELVTF